MRCFVLSEELWSKWVFKCLYWARRSGAHECLCLCWVRSSGTHELWKHLCSAWSYEAHEKIKLEVLEINPKAFQVDVEHKLWNIRSLAIVSLCVSYKYMLELVLSEENWICTNFVLLIFSIEYGLWISDRSYWKELMISSENDSSKILISSDLFISDKMKSWIFVSCQVLKNYHVIRGNPTWKEV